MDESRKSSRGKWWVFAVPIAIVITGLTLLGYYGLDYAKQTIWLNHEHLATYQPTPESWQPSGPQGNGSQANGSQPSGSQANGSQANGSQANGSQANGSQSHGSSIGTLHTKHTTSSQTQPKHVVRLWPTLPEPGTKLGELSFPSIKLTVPVVQGTHWDELKLGVGHYVASTLPGQGGNVFLSGHRDTVFAKMRFLKKGDRIVFSTPYGPFVYEATHFKIVSKDDTSVMVPTNYETLTLSTCYPFFYIGFAPNRYIVYTKLVSEPKVAHLAAAKK